MTSPTPIGQCIDAFIRRDYHRCAELCSTHFEQVRTLDMGQLWIISLLRENRMDEATEVGIKLLTGFAHPFDTELIKMSFGKGDIEQLGAMAKTPEERWKLVYYTGAYLLTFRAPEQAGKTFNQILLSGVPPVASTEMYLLTVENNFVTTGSSGTDIDRPVLELNQIAEKQFSEGKLDAALKVVERTYELAKSSLGSQHPCYITAVNNLGAIHYSMGHFAEALPYMQELSKLRELQFGSRTPPVIDAFDMLAQTYQRLGKFENAEAVFSQIVDVRRESLGNEHRDVAKAQNHLAMLYTEMGDSRAEPLYREALETIRTAVGEDHPDYAAIAHNLAEACRARGNYAEAEPLIRKAVDILRKAGGPSSPDYLSAVRNQAQLCLDMGNLAEAEQLFREVTDGRRAALGESHPDFAESQAGLGQLYLERGNYQAAVPLFEQAVAIRRQAFGEGHLKYADSLNSLAVAYRDLGRHREAEPLFRQAISIYQNVLGESHRSVATLLDNLAGLLRTTGDYTQAEQLYQQALKIHEQSSEQAGTQESADAARVQNNFAGLYREQGKYEEAETLYLHALAATKNELGERHPRVASMLNNLATLYVEQGQYEMALPLFRDSLDLLRETKGEAHVFTAQTLGSLADVEFKSGDFKAAEPHFREGLERVREAVGEEHSLYATALTNFSGLCRAQGNYREAETAMRKAADIDRRMLGEDHPHYAADLGNLALLYQDLGNFAAAEPLLVQAMDITRGAVGEDHPSYATRLNTLGCLYYAQGKMDAAEPLLRKALEIRRKFFGNEHNGVASVLSNLSAVREYQGEFQEALDLLVEAKEIREKGIGRRHPDFAAILCNLSVFGANIGSFELAEQQAREALDIWNECYGKQHPEYATGLNNLATICAAQGRMDEARELMEQANAIHDELIGYVFSISSESQRTAFLNRVRGYWEAYLSLILTHFSDSAEARRAAYDAVLRRKAIGLEALAAQRDSVLRGRYPELKEQFNELNTLRRQIAQKSLAGVGPEGLQGHKQQLESWKAEQERLEAELARKIPEINLFQQLRACDRRAVALGLPEGVILAEFVRLPIYNFEAIAANGDQKWQPTRYIAFVLPAGEPDNVQLVDLGESEPIDQMIAAFRDGILDSAGGRSARDLGAAPAQTAADAPTEDAAPRAIPGGEPLRAAIFDPLQKHLNGGHRLILALDGDLTRIPFEVLPTSDSNLLIDDFELNYVGTGRDVLRWSVASSEAASEPLVAADPNFDLKAEPPKPVPVASVPPVTKDGAKKPGFFARLFGKSTPEEVKQPVQPVVSAEAVAKAHEEPAAPRTRAVDRAGIRFTSLPGTRVEGEGIAAQLGVKPWLGNEALEARLKSCHSPRILHLATHGFFLEDQRQDANREFRDLGMVPETSTTDGIGRFTRTGLENPLLRSGLALAGVNSWLASSPVPDDAEDGLLTAEDVSGLDLCDTELVVLSACETGLGEVRVGEGVFGMCRAFAIAGARTLIMSLWKVPDDTTQELMEDFYRRVLSGQGRAEALREAQRALRKKHAHPLYWGAFICQGNPGSLTVEANAVHEVTASQT